MLRWIDHKGNGNLNNIVITLVQLHRPLSNRQKIKSICKDLKKEIFMLFYVGTSISEGTDLSTVI